MEAAPTARRVSPALRPLPPIQWREEYAHQLEGKLVEWFREVVFDPLFGMLNEAGVELDPTYQAIKHDETGRQNVVLTALIRALLSGRVWYYNGAFHGRFNLKIASQIRAIGGKLFPYQSGAVYRIAEEDLPMEIRSALSQAKVQALGLQRQMVDFLTVAEANLRIAPQLGLSYEEVLGKTLEDLQHQLVRTASKPLDIAIPAELNPAMQQALNEQFIGNLDLAVRNFTPEMVGEMRMDVQAAFENGIRAEQLADIIEAKFGVTKRKAAFLARQELSLIAAKYAAEEYKAMGCEFYRWSTSHDEVVRPAHRKLNNTVHRWDDPPLIEGTNRYCNPGEDYNCRCVAVPLANLGD